FLIGLDDVFNSVRSIILTTKPKPDVESAFATLSRDESHMNSHSSSKNVKVGPYAFATRPSNSNWNSNRNNTNTNNNRKFGRLSNLVFKHCNMIRHTIDRCFELVGYPPGVKKVNVNHNNVNNAHIDDNKADHSKSIAHTLTSDQYQRFMSLLSDIGNASKSHASIASTFMVRILQKSQENGQNRTNKDTETELSVQKPENAIKGQPKSTHGQH
ncbi:hypothetical protein Tco_1398917, partial [Tanacetum coccineum]